MKALLKKPGRHSDGDGLYFRTIGLGRAYWAYRYRSGGKTREMSLGPYPEVSLAEARDKHAAARKAVIVDKLDPLASKRAAKEAGAARAGIPTFGEAADGLCPGARSLLAQSQARGAVAHDADQILRGHPGHGGRQD